MKKITIRELTTLAILIALSIVLAHITIPTPTGFLTLLDVGIYFTAFCLGSRQGAIVGGFSGFLIDLLLGYPQYMFHSLIAHGAQGYFAGWKGIKRPIGLVIASFLMIGWYALAALLLGYGWGGAIGTLLGNAVQNFFGMLVGYLLYRVYRRVKKEV